MSEYFEISTADTGSPLHSFSMHKCGFYNWLEILSANTWELRRGKVQMSGQEGCSRASYLIGLTELE